MSRVERKKKSNDADKKALAEQKAAIKARREARKTEMKAAKGKQAETGTDDVVVTEGSNAFDKIKSKVILKWNKFKEWFKAQERWKQILMIAGTTLVTLLLILFIVVWGIFNSLFGSIFAETPDDYDLSLTAVDGYYNILLLGVDSRDMDNLEGTRSDAIMVVSINEETNDVKILSVYRDTYLKMGATSTYDKITHACVYGGPEMTMKSLNQALDIDISNYVVVNFKAVADLVDAVGGIEVHVEDYEIKQLNKYTIETAENIGRTDYQLVEESGLQTLDGCQAVSYSRIRKGVGDDFKRTERMRTVISLTMEKMKDMSFKDLKSIIKMMTSQVQTNISKSNILALAIRLPQYNIIGTDGWPYNVRTGLVNGTSYVFPANLASNTTKMHQEFFGEDDYVPSLTVKTISNTIIKNLEAEREAGKIEGEEELDIDTSNGGNTGSESGGATDVDTNDDVNNDTDSDAGNGYTDSGNNDNENSDAGSGETDGDLGTGEDSSADGGSDDSGEFGGESGEGAAA